MTIKVVQTWPLKMRLKINGTKLSRNVGNRLATYVRKQWASGLTGGGEALPQPLQLVPERKGPLRITEHLLKSVRYSTRYQMVMASNLERRSKRPDGTMRPLSKRAGSLYGLTRILISGKWRRISGTQEVRLQSGRRVQRRTAGASVRPVVDLYGDQSASIVTRKEALAQKELQRQLASGELGLLTELQQTYRDGKRGRR